MRRVIVESPYAATMEHGVESNIAYARRCVRDSLARGEAPIASHILYTQEGILDDNVPAERAQGIAAGLAWFAAAEAVVFYIDRGWSRGMKEAAMALINRTVEGEPAIEVRRLDG